MIEVYLYATYVPYDMALDFVPANVLNEKLWNQTITFVASDFSMAT